MRACSPLRYPGGKANLTKLIEQSILGLNLEGCTYVEPFAGGGGAALNLLFRDVVKEIVLNDKDVAVYSFWKGVLNENRRFQERLMTVSLTIEEWQRQRMIYDNGARGYSFDLGFAFFYLNRTNRSGILKAGPIGGYTQTGNYLIDARFNRDALCTRLERIHAYRDQIKVKRLEAVTLLRQEFSRNASRDRFYYIDPPYYIKGKRLYAKFYYHKDHQNLADLLIENRQHTWLMSYDDVEEINEIYQDFNRYKINLRYSVASVRQASEILIASTQKVIPHEALPAFAGKFVA